MKRTKNPVIKILFVVMAVISIGFMALVAWRYHKDYEGPQIAGTYLIGFLNDKASVRSGKLFTYRYEPVVMRNRCVYIREPEFEIEEDGTDRWLMTFTGLVKNSQGEALKKSFTFKIRYENYEYRIDDSYDFILFDQDQIVFEPGISDMEKATLLGGLSY